MYQNLQNKIYQAKTKKHRKSNTTHTRARARTRTRINKTTNKAIQISDKYTGFITNIFLEYEQCHTNCGINQTLIKYMKYI